VVQHKTPLRVVYIPIKYPVVSEQDLIATFEAELNKYNNAAGGGVKLCIFDHVSSMVWRPSRHYPILLKVADIVCIHTHSRPLSFPSRLLLLWQKRRGRWFLSTARTHQAWLIST
jgi:hypothetical protein